MENHPGDHLKTLLFLIASISAIEIHVILSIVGVSHYIIYIFLKILKEFNDWNDRI